MKKREREKRQRERCAERRDKKPTSQDKQQQ
jgi:hypothetical protein